MPTRQAPNRKYEPETIGRALQLIQNGKTAAEASKATGIALTTLRIYAAPSSRNKPLVQAALKTLNGAAKASAEDAAPVTPVPRGDRRDDRIRELEEEVRYLRKQVSKMWAKEE